MKYYFCVFSAYWVIVRAESRLKARAEVLHRFGRHNVKLVRNATDAEVKSFIAQKGESAIIEV